MTDGTGDVTINVQSSATAEHLTLKIEVEPCPACHCSGATTSGVCSTCWGEGYTLKIG